MRSALLDVKPNSISISILCALIACSPPEREPGSMPGDRAPASGSRAASAHGKPDVPADAPLVVFLGDSLSAGLHLTADEAFPAVLQRDLSRRGHPFRLVNAGVSGDTSAGGVSRVDWLLRQAPDVLVLELGGNDGLRGEDLARVEANLRVVVERARSAGASVLLLGMRLPRSYGPAYADEFAALYERIARDFDLAFVPFVMDRVGGVAELTLPDGLHPTARGHEILAENVAPALIDVLAERAQSKR